MKLSPWTSEQQMRCHAAAEALRLQLIVPEKTACPVMLLMQAEEVGWGGTSSTQPRFNSNCKPREPVRHHVRSSRLQRAAVTRRSRYIQGLMTSKGL